MVDVGGPLCKVSFEPFNLNSYPQVKGYLLSQGWEPTEWNEDDQGNRTSPKITEDSLDSVQGEFGRGIIERAVLRHRLGLIHNITRAGKHTGFLNFLRSDGRIEAQGIPQATNTGRYRHRQVVNVPKAKESILYGPEIRSLFTASEGKRLLGADASGLEARIQGHYIYSYEGGEAYANELIHGDIHSDNAAIFGTDRDGAKSPYYALIYGAQVPKLAETLGCSVQKAGRIFEDFWNHNLPLKLFKDDCIRVWQQRGGRKGGYLRGLDGRKLYARSEHSLVNMMFQSAGSIVVKKATQLLEDWIIDKGLDSRRVIHYHDEFEFDVPEKEVDIMTELMLQSFVKAGEYFNLNVPIVGDVKVGNNWKEVH